ncbi:MULTISPECIES: YncE family protein [unclassified Thioalkalivibrio]|uniref:YncE family protein n=1 Tax=unclassified Thioalkalivibrio TaxID=2621013 RepID=UPI0003803D03|nr:MULTISPECIES: cytochrome D1 domain-containing protein [unclassified Thioalkalivibrio]
MSNQSCKPLFPGMLVGAIALAIAPFSTAQADPVWPDVMIHLHGDGEANIVDIETDRVAAKLETCPGGTLGSTTPDASKVYVSCAGEGETDVVVIDLNELEVSGRIATGNRPKHGLVSPDGRMVGVDHWALSDGKLRITFLDTESDEIKKKLDIEVQGEPDGVTSMHNAWSAGSRYFFTVDRVDNRMVIVDTQDWSTDKVDSPSAPHYPVPSPNGEELWLVHEGDDEHGPGVVIFDLTQDGYPELTRLSMPLTGEEVEEAHHGNFTQDGSLFMVLNRGPGGDARGREVAFFDAESKELVHRVTTASNGVGHSYNSPDGRHVVVTNYGNNVITVIDLEEMRTVADLTIGEGRMGHVAFTEDGRYGYVSNAGDGNLHKVDMETFEVVREIETGGRSGGGQVLNVWTNVFEELPR